MLTLSKRFFGVLLCVMGLLPLSSEEAKAEVKPKAEEPSFMIKANQEETRIMEEIITTISKNNLISLGFKRSHLKQLGQRLRHLGPLQFLAYIFTNENLKMHMASIRNHSTKWKGFMEGLIPGLNRDASTNILFNDLPGFAKFVGAEPSVLIQKAQAREWYSFVDIVQNSSMMAKSEEVPVKEPLSEQKQTDQTISTATTPVDRAASTPSSSAK